LPAPAARSRPPTSFRASRRAKGIEHDIALTLRAYVRYGDVATPGGGKTFALRRVA
jgi:hypothetical protein